MEIKKLDWIPVANRVIVKRDIVEERTASGIILPEINQKREQGAKSYGRILALGPYAFSGTKDAKLVSIGSRVVFEVYAGCEFVNEEFDPEDQVYVINDLDVIAVRNDCDCDSKAAYACAWTKGGKNGNCNK